MSPAPAGRALRSAGPVLAVLAVLGCAAFLFWPLVRGQLTGEPRFLEWDVPEQYWPDLVYLCSSLHELELPAWNPYDRAGYPYFADPQAGIYHPLHWAICALAGPSPGLGWAEARCALGFVLAGLFGLAWLRRLRFGWGPSMVGAVVLQAAPFMRHNFELLLTWGLAWMPLMLWAAEGLAQRRRMRDGAWLAAATALCAWAGSPPALWQAGTLTGLYLLWRLVTIWRAERRAMLAPAGLSLAAAALLALGLCGAVLFPGVELAGLSVQADSSCASIAAGGLEPGKLWGLVWPLPGNHLYTGLAAVFLAVLGLWPLRWRSAGARAGLPGAGAAPAPPAETPVVPRFFFAGIFVLSVLMALGEHGLLFGPACELLPGVSLFRLPHRYEAWLGPAAAGLCACGLSTLPGLRAAGWLQRRPRVRWPLAGAFALAGAAWLVFGPGFGPAALMLMAAVWLAASALGPRAPLAGLVLAAACAVLLPVDLGQALPAERHSVPGRMPKGAARERAEAVLARLGDLQNDWRCMDEFGISCRSGTRLGRRELRGYQDPLLLKAHERVLSSLRAHPRLAEQFNVRYALTGPHYIHGWNRHFLPLPAELLVRVPGSVDLGEGVIELPEPLPAAYWVPYSQAELAASRTAAQARIRELAPAPAAVIDRGSLGPGVSPELARVLSASRHARTPAVLRAAEGFALERDRLRFRILAPEPGVVVINEAWYPGWQARVDGQEVELLRANGLVRAFAVEKGMHEVQMDFRPLSARLWRWILLLGLACTLALLILPAGRFPERRGAP
ncbi:MAG: hypothetical protein JXR96_12265 [Deltaproteobacteria bacterium]|nr:hypothetical protein [Deltaproteobacteria bacterium]